MQINMSIVNSRSRGAAVNAIVMFIFLASQTLAASIHFDRDLDRTAGYPHVESDCPAHQASTDEADQQESCECPGGGCCNGNIDRSHAHLIADISTKAVERPAALPAVTQVNFTSRRITSGTQSRAPPLSSLV